MNFRGLNFRRGTVSKSEQLVWRILKASSLLRYENEKEVEADFKQIKDNWANFYALGKKSQVCRKDQPEITAESSTELMRP